MTCEEMMRIPEIKAGIKVVAGERALSRTVRWIYFADCTLSLPDDYNWAEIVSGGELIIVTNKNLADDDKKIIGMIKQMEEKRMAGYMIDEGRLSDNVLQYCKEHEIPLFENSLNLRLVDFSYILCKRLMEEERELNTKERLLSSILSNSGFDKEKIKEQAEYLGVNLSKNNRILVVKHLNTGKLDKGKNFIDVADRIRRIVRNELDAFGLQYLLTTWQVDKCVALILGDDYSQELLTNILTNIVNTSEQYKITVKIGVGNTYEFLDDIRTSYQEAKSALDIYGNLKPNQRIFFYDNLGIYSLIAQVQNDKFLSEFVENKIGLLIQNDQLQEGELCKTLEAFLDNNCKYNITAEALFIHQNTMHYRMDRIKKILGRDINDLSDYMELKLAFSIRDFLESKKKE